MSQTIVRQLRNSISSNNFTNLLQTYAKNGDNAQNLGSSVMLQYTSTISVGVSLSIGGVKSAMSSPSTAPTLAPTQSSSLDLNLKLSQTAIIGIAVGLVILVVTCCCAIIIYVRTKEEKHKAYEVWSSHEENKRTATNNVAPSGVHSPTPLVRMDHVYKDAEVISHNPIQTTAEQRQSLARASVGGGAMGATHGRGTGTADDFSHDAAYAQKDVQYHEAPVSKADLRRASANVASRPQAPLPAHSDDNFDHSQVYSDQPDEIVGGVKKDKRKSVEFADGTKHP